MSFLVPTFLTSLWPPRSADCQLLLQCRAACVQCARDRPHELGLLPLPLFQEAVEVPLFDEGEGLAAGLVPITRENLLLGTLENRIGPTCTPDDTPQRTSG